jgi:hypothetical protein
MMTQGILIEDVLFDAYYPETKIPLKILVDDFMISAYSFKRVTMVIIMNHFQKNADYGKTQAFYPIFCFCFAL